MMKSFKTAFRGYKKSDVEAVLHDSDQQIEKLSQKNEMMERELSDLRIKLQANEAVIDEQKKAIERAGENLRSMQHQMELTFSKRAEDLRKNRSDAENLGGLYIHAYEFSRQIAAAPKIHIDGFMDRVEESSNQAMAELSGAKENFAFATERIKGIIGEISQQNKNILAQLERLSDSLDEAGDVYGTVGKVRKDLDRSVAELEVKYDKSVSALMQKGNSSELRRSEASLAVEDIKQVSMRAQSDASSGRDTSESVDMPTFSEDSVLSHPEVRKIQPDQIRVDFKSSVLESTDADQETLSASGADRTVPVADEVSIDVEEANTDDFYIASVDNTDGEKEPVVSKVSVDSVATRGRNILQVLNKYCQHD